jgi:hypothetical protein
MKLSGFRFAGIWMCCSAGLMAQTSREAYRQDYDAWREVHANLERDAGSGGATLIQQLDRAAARVAAFGTNRAAYAKAAAKTAAEQRQVLQAPTTRPSLNLAPPTIAALVAEQLQTVTRTITRFAEDRDRGIQQLRQSLERERDALAALNGSIEVRQKAVAKTTEADTALELLRARTAEILDAETSALLQNAVQLEKETAAWAAYYEGLTKAIQVANAPPPPRVEVTTVAPRNDTAPGIPRARYVGAWTYPSSNGIFHGAQPEFVDLVVHETNGHADGTLFARFRLPGGATDPLVRFDFQGDFAAAALQRFPLVTSDGTKGTIELIPGPAFNLLEVNFVADPRQGKINVGNFILVKK